MLIHIWDRKMDTMTLEYLSVRSVQSLNIVYLLLQEYTSVYIPHKEVRQDSDQAFGSSYLYAVSTIQIIEKPTVN